MFVPADLTQRRGRIFPGGNPSRFMELVGATDVLYQFWEPDADTTRESYFYNTRMNVLYKKHRVINHLDREQSHVWKSVSEY